MTAVQEATPNSLVRYESMVRAIAECHRVDEVTQLHSQAIALEAYARQARNFDAEKQCAAIRIRAERKAGELLRTMTKNEGAKGSGQNQHTKREVRSCRPTTPLSEPEVLASYPRAPNETQESVAPTLKSMGISKEQSSTWQKLADVPEKDFEREISRPNVIPTTAGILRNTNSEKDVASGPPPSPALGSKEAMWAWGLVRDFSREKVGERNPADIKKALLPTLHVDLQQTLPKLIDWLQQLEKVMR